jgi:hypothetical protein
MVDVVKVVKRQIFSVVGSVTSVIFYVYNAIKPTNVQIAPQSALGSGSTAVVVSLGALAVLLMGISVVVFFFVRVKQKHRRG